MNDDSLNKQDIACQIVNGSKLINVQLTSEMIEKLSHLVSLIIESNKKVNITAIKKPEEIVTKHILDSLSIIPHLPKNIRSIADVGSGGGFPAIPLAIALPHIKVCAIESIGKKTKVIEYISDTLNIKNIEIVNARAEDVCKHPDYKESFDIALARAVTQLPKLSHYLLPLVCSKGMMLAQKSLGTAQSELVQAKENIIALGGVYDRAEIIKIEVSSLEPRALIKVPKN